MNFSDQKIPAVLRDHTGYLITDIGRLYRTALDRRMKRFGLTRSQWWLISFLYYFDGSTQQQLADVMDNGKSGVAKLIDRLEQKGMVTRTSDAKDGRSKRVYLSDKVKPLAAKIERELSQTAGNSLRALDHAQILLLNQMLKDIRGTLIEDQAKSANGRKPKAAKRAMVAAK
jgi:DNA-binding MarR family transcriptional regulator